jgi:hypothetical protein
MLRNITVAVILYGALQGPAVAVNAAVRAACVGDAHRLCEPVISDETKRRACMHAHAAELSEGCKTAIRANR